MVTWLLMLLALKPGLEAVELEPAAEISEIIRPISRQDCRLFDAWPPFCLYQFEALDSDRIYAIEIRRAGQPDWKRVGTITIEDVAGGRLTIGDAGDAHAWRLTVIGQNFRWWFRHEDPPGGITHQP
jgi:hypothetical protein